ncbi:hypothetical protein [Acidithiobacillus caldus]|jgi:hypothetical protein|uniref:hypothetical protein n=1 Tax=Acidithiobacillus caldus TaxID=33059 RepID=UPI00056F1DE2|nr:hypothetical protein [Acidithiobacillus caldus]MBU2728586.1 hypothetical protein [Acidithiobacillus caldus]MBU2736017.1 hypothetical protein [Acidithiobacillus caldus ATCC 51756]MBU2746279.1 hypothetical protein [Acidithiobacillus caldus]MBU2779151.1 hypothetical protein [Acidithiobacillus caldus]
MTTQANTISPLWVKPWGAMRSIFRWMLEALGATILIFGLFLVIVALTHQIPSLGRLIAFHPVGSAQGFLDAFWIVFVFYTFLICTIKITKSWVSSFLASLIAMPILLTFVALLFFGHEGSVVNHATFPPPPPVFHPIKKHEKVLMQMVTTHNTGKYIGKVSEETITGNAKITSMGHGRYLVKMEK